MGISYSVLLDRVCFGTATVAPLPTLYGAGRNLWRGQLGAADRRPEPTIVAIVAAASWFLYGITEHKPEPVWLNAWGGGAQMVNMVAFLVLTDHARAPLLILSLPLAGFFYVAVMLVGISHLQVVVYQCLCAFAGMLAAAAPLLTFPFLLDNPLAELLPPWWVSLGYTAHGFVWCVRALRPDHQNLYMLSQNVVVFACNGYQLYHAMRWPLPNLAINQANQDLLEGLLANQPINGGEDHNLPIANNHQDLPLAGGNNQDLPIVGGNNQGQPIVAEDNNHNLPLAGGNNQALPIVGGNNQGQPIVAGDNNHNLPLAGNNQALPIVGGNNQGQPIVAEDNNHNLPLAGGNNQDAHNDDDDGEDAHNDDDEDGAEDAHNDDDDGNGAEDAHDGDDDDDENGADADEDAADNNEHGNEDVHDDNDGHGHDHDEQLGGGDDALGDGDEQLGDDNEEEEAAEEVPVIPDQPILRRSPRLAALALAAALAANH